MVRGKWTKWTNVMGHNRHLIWRYILFTFTRISNEISVVFMASINSNRTHHYKVQCIKVETKPFLSSTKEFVARKVFKIIFVYSKQ